MTRMITNNDVLVAADEAVDRIIKRFGSDRPLALHGIPRGGIPAAYAVLSHARMHPVPWYVTDDPTEADVFIDDLVDSGATKLRYEALYGRPVFPLFNKQGDDRWYIFPWEGTAAGSTEDIGTRLLQAVGEDASREGLAETPDRWMRAWREHWASGYDTDPTALLKAFADGAEDYDEMVLVRDIPVYSHCEHHMAPIFGRAYVAYIPDGRVVGLSKINRVVDAYARRLQVQERLTTQVADCIEQVLQPKGVAVMMRCRHMCMESRGVCQQGHTTITSAMRGVFRDASTGARNEFLSLCNQGPEQT